MGGFEIFLIVIGAIIGIGLIVAAIALLSGVLKKSADPENKSGWFGWIVAIIIAALILYFYTKFSREPDYRHSENCTEYIQYTCSA